jgi:hypothetical protein
MAGGELRQALDQRDPDVPAEHGARADRGREQGVRQRRGGRLALGARDADRRCRAQAQEQVNLGHDRRCPAVATSPSCHEVGEHGPEARLGRWEVGVDRRRGGHERGPGGCRCRVDVGPEQQPHRTTVEGGECAPELSGRTRVVDRDSCARVGEEARERDPRAREAEHAHRPVAEAARAERAGREVGEVDHGDRGHRDHSRLIDARKSVTPMSPAMMPTIQNRSVIFSSSQPFSS